MAENNINDEVEIKTHEHDDDLIKGRFDEIQSFLGDFTKEGVQKMSKNNKIQLLKIQMKLAMLNMEDDEFEPTEEDLRTLENVKKESKRVETANSLPKDLKNLIVKDTDNYEEKEDNHSTRNLVKAKSEKKKKKPNRKSESDESGSCRSQKGHKKKIPMKAKSSSEDSSNSDSSSSSSEEERDIERKRKKHGNLKTRDYLQIMAERMDNRRAPKFEKFDEDSGQSLKEYLEEFEEDCMENIKGDCKNWVKELEGKLTGDLGDAVKQFRKYRHSYPKLKKKLLEWYEDMEEAREEEYKNKFEMMTHKKGESLYLYSTRLERSFDLAYPDEDNQKSYKLRQKYLDTVPSSFRKELKSIISYDSHVKKQTKWRDIQRDARRADADRKASKKQDVKDDSGSEEEIIINIGNDQTSQQNKIGNNSSNCIKCNNINSRNYQPSQQQNRQFFNQGNNQRQTNQNYGNQSRGRATNSNYNQIRMNQPNRNNNQNQRRWNRSIPMCQHCDRPGHTIDVCRIRQGLCPICAKPGHTEQDCYYRNKHNQQNNQSNSQSYNQGQQSSNQNNNAERKPSQPLN